VIMFNHQTDPEWQDHPAKNDQQSFRVLWSLGVHRIVRGNRLQNGSDIKKSSSLDDGVNQRFFEPKTQIKGEPTENNSVCPVHSAPERVPSDSNIK
jgi:hypothetical protein